MSNKQIDHAQNLADCLRGEGHHAAADKVEGAISGSQFGDGLLHALRDACQFVLTAIEVLDPKTGMMAEQLRLEIDKRLSH